MNNGIIEIINKISNMNGNNLLDKIMDYCETYDINEQALGDLLQENEDFKNILYRDCVKHNIIKDSKIEVNKNLEIW